MFNAAKAKLAEVEGKATAMVSGAKARVTAAEATVKALGAGAAAPLVKAEAAVKKADQDVAQLFAPLKARAVRVAPPGQ